MGEEITVAQLREEMKKELDAYKAEVQKQMADKDAQIKQLSESNKSLNSEIVKATLYSSNLNKEDDKSKEDKEEDKAIKEWNRLTTLTKQRMKAQLRLNDEK